MIGYAEHAWTLRTSERQNYLFTQFCRLPTQNETLVGPVVDFLNVEPDAELRIIVFGCSIGAEPYSIASALRARRADLRVRIECYDIEPDVIARARAARYSVDEVSTRYVTQEFIDRTFDVAGEMVVKPELTARVHFQCGNVLDRSLVDRLEQADVVIAQNFLYHLPRPDAERAFRNLFRLLKPRSALLVDGTDLDMRARLTAEAGLRPCTIELERIHEESRALRGYVWPRVYWGLEPFDLKRSDAARRYATIFLRDVRTSAPAITASAG
jgi:chemotaxis protein methyltransferase CheR